MSDLVHLWGAYILVSGYVRIVKMYLLLDPIFVVCLVLFKLRSFLYQSMIDAIENQFNTMYTVVVINYRYDGS